MPYRKKCAKCDQRAVLKWTLFNEHVAVLVPLCAEHGEPLSELVTLALTEPTPETGSIPKVTAGLRARPLDWKKPEEG
jgi:hypothetical protein